MRSSLYSEKVHIHITTYQNSHRDPRIVCENMDKRNHLYDSKYICSMCLNTKPLNKRNEKDDCDKGIDLSCPACENTCKMNVNNIMKPNKTRERNVPATTNRNKDLNKTIDSNVKTKSIQTSQTNIVEGLSLLSEVLQVFKNKQDDGRKVDKNAKFVPCKAIDLTKLTFSKTFTISIEEKLPWPNIDKMKCVILHSCQPERNNCSENAITLIKQKSSSIPQMKLEELKYSLKEKTKSKDTIEEVNRMFATVRKSEFGDDDNGNRPMVRNGPRLLPVVKNKDFCPKKEMKNKLCDCCTCANGLSSGDNVVPNVETTVCQHNACMVKCKKCIYTLCQRYTNPCYEETKGFVCEDCKSVIQDTCQCCGVDQVRPTRLQTKH